MGSKNKAPFISFKRLFRSFQHAWNGIKHTWMKEQNFRVHLLLMIAVFSVAQLLKVPLVEQALLVIVIGIVLALELVNTAIENVVDMMVQTYDIRAKIIKDVAAGAVLAFAIVAVIVGLLIFLPKIILLFT